MRVAISRSRAAECCRAEASPGLRSALQVPPDVAGRRKLGELRIKARYKVRANGTVYLPADPQRPTDAQCLLIASRATSHLRTAVLLWAFPDRAWWLLYRVVEDIETHLNELDIATSVSEAGYCPGKERARFRHSANSAEASGLGARHAAGKWDPPKDPTSLEDATIFVKGLLEQALRDGRV